MTWDEVKQKGSRHYKTGGVEPIDLLKHTKPDASLTVSKNVVQTSDIQIIRRLF